MLIELYTKDTHLRSICDFQAKVSWARLLSIVVSKSNRLLISCKIIEGKEQPRKVRNNTQFLGF